MIRQLEEHNIPGATLSIVEDGKIILAEWFGTADKATMTPVDPQPGLFRIGSVSKLITWTAVMQPAEQGKIDLDAEINTYLDFGIPPRIIKNRRGKPGPITMRYLPIHTLGFEDAGESLFVPAPDELIPLQEYLQNHIPARVFQPGKVLAYSNYGTAPAGNIAAQVSGQAFAEYAEEHILAPLNLLL